MLEKFTLYNGLAACSTNEGNTIVFSPYNFSIGVLESNKNDASTFQLLQKLGTFGTASSQGPSRPENYDLTLVITNDCNLRCKYCFARGGEKRDYMSTETALTIVDYVFHKIDRKNIKVAFFGGEPTLNINVIRNVVSFVKKLAPSLGKAYAFQITTNGVISSRTLKFLVNSDFAFVVSSDGIPPLQNFLRPAIYEQPSCHYVEKTIKYLVKKNVPLQIRSTISQYNVNHMAENVRYFASLGVRLVHFEPITYAGRGKSNDDNLKRAEIHDYVKHFKLALDAAKECDISVISHSYMNFLAPSYKFCDAMAGSRSIGSYNGDMTLCVEVQDACHPYSSHAFVGRLDNQTKGISFDYKKYGKIITNVPTEQNADCTQCFAKYSCGGGCPVKNFHSSGCEVVDGYRCSLTKEIVSEVLQRIYRESAVASNVFYRSHSITLYRMRIPEEIWMKRKNYKLSNILAEIIIDPENEAAS